MFVQDPRLNNDVANIINDLKEQLILNFRPKSIILIGSFGRGEATVIQSGCNLKFLSDCEVLIVPNNHLFDQMAIKKFCYDFFKKTGLEITIGGVLISLYLSSSFFTKRLRPTIGNIDLKYGSKVIYGFNYLNQIPDIKPNDIPVWEGIRLILNRMAEALDHFSIKSPSEDMFFWTNKIVLACQDTLLILAGLYTPSYRIRNDLFKKIYKNNFNCLYQKIPNFLDLSIKATNYKLGKCNRYHDDIIEFWFEVRNIVDIIFKYIIDVEMGIRFNSYIRFQKYYLNNSLIQNSYFRGLTPNSLYQNITVLLKSYLLKNEGLPIKLMHRIKTPWIHIIYSSIPILYFSLNKYGYIDEISLKHLNNVLSWFNCSFDFVIESLDLSENIKKQVLHLWYSYCY